MTPGTTGASPATARGGIVKSLEPRDAGTRRATGQSDADGLGGEALLSLYRWIELYERTGRSRD